MTRSEYAIDHRGLTVRVEADSEQRAEEAGREIIDLLLLDGPELPETYADDVVIKKRPNLEELRDHPARRRAVRRSGSSAMNWKVSRPTIRGSGR
jgi:hypothetical protein